MKRKRTIKRPYLPICAMLLCGILLMFAGCTSVPSEEINVAASGSSQESALYVGRFSGIWGTDDGTLCNEDIEIGNDLITYSSSPYEKLIKNIFKNRNVEISNQKDWKIPYEPIGISEQTIYFRLFVETLDFDLVIDGKPCVARISFASSSSGTQSSWMMYAPNTCRLSIFLKVCGWSVVSSLNGEVLEEGHSPLSLRFITTKATK